MQTSVDLVLNVVSFLKKSKAESIAMLQRSSFWCFPNPHILFAVHQGISDPHADAETDIWDNVDCRKCSIIVLNAWMKLTAS